MKNASIDNLNNKEKQKKSLSQQRNKSALNQSTTLAASSTYFNDILDIFQINSMAKSIVNVEQQLDKDLQKT